MTQLAEQTKQPLLTLVQIKAGLKKLKLEKQGKQLFKSELTQKDIQELFDYNPETGVFKWKVSKSPIKRGAIAGTQSANGYIQIMVYGKRYYAHRLAWFYVHGYFPEQTIDHINRNTFDNRLANLREVSLQCNSRNAKKQCNNKSGITGVCWNTRQARWYVQIKVKNKAHYLGVFKDYEEAICNRLAAEQCLSWEGCDSNSSAYNYVQEHVLGRKTNGSTTN